MRTVALYGNSVALSSIAASLEGRSGLRVVPAHKLGALQPDAVIVDLAAPQSDFDIAAWKAQPRVLLIGVDLGSNRMFVLSGQPTRVLTFENLYEAIETLPQGEHMAIKNKKYVWLAAGGAVLATLIVCFSLGWPPVSRKNVQGAIGQRDVYRQSQLTDKDVGVAGQAKVTVDDVRALLESPEFKTLAKDPQFQKMLAESKAGDLNNLINQYRAAAKADEFRAAAKADEFRAAAKADEFRAAAAKADEFRAAKSDAAFTALASNARFSSALSMVAQSQALQSLAQSGRLDQATVAGAAQNSVLQALPQQAR